ncbi:MAG: putative ABC transporter permease, partial [Spirochaetales bacterium]|nr:putative ABC transporter permease [Spirochaetales bacterium]
MEYLTNLLLLFFIYSFAGWCIEVILKFRQYHRFINRGFLTGPCLPIYGSGCALITAAVDILVMISRYESSYGSVFAVAFVLCGVLEYTVSYLLEKRFHARWWDYSQKPMNLHGRVWIGNLLLFGLGGVLVVKVTNPVILRFFAGISLKARYITAIALSVVFITDYLISHFVLKLVKDSVEKSEADNTEAIGKEVRKMLSDKSLFAKRFADAYPEVIYRTEKVKARMEAIKAETERLRMQAEERFAEVQQQISEKLEPTSQIKNRIIENQD